MEPISIHRGFSLIELVVAAAIISVIALIVITNQGSFNNSTELANAAYDVALSVRSAESYGLGSRVSGAGVSNAGFGIHFPQTPTNTYMLFSDVNSPSSSSCHGIPTGETAAAPDAQYGDCVYQSSEKVSAYTLGNGITISGVCIYQSGSGVCHPINSGDGTLDIVFARPNPDVFFSTGGTYSATPVIRSACITLSTQSGTSRYVSVTQYGAVLASATPCNGN